MYIFVYVSWFIRIHEYIGVNYFYSGGLLCD